MDSDSGHQVVLGLHPPFAAPAHSKFYLSGVPLRQSSTSARAPYASRHWLLLTIEPYRERLRESRARPLYILGVEAQWRMLSGLTMGTILDDLPNRLEPRASFSGRHQPQLATSSGAAARRSSRLRRYLSRRRLVLCSQARASFACVSMVGRLETLPLRSVARRSLPDRLAVDLRSSIVASFGPSVASKVALRIKATNLSQSSAVMAFGGERTPSGSESSPTL
jgi:hypothetical protein